jgi:hypothetical protein
LWIGARTQLRALHAASSDGSLSIFIGRAFQGPSTYTACQGRSSFRQASAFHPLRTFAEGLLSAIADIHITVLRPDTLVP